MDVTATFGELVGELDYSMFIVTVCAGDERAGCLVGFGTQTSIDPPRGLPILPERGNWFVGRVIERLDLGDHVGFLLEPVAAHREGSQQHVEFHRAKAITPGHPA